MLTKDQLCIQFMKESIDKILEYTSEFENADDFNEDYRNFDATMMNFIVIGEMIDKLSNDFKEHNHFIDWQKIKGFRNIIAHDYFGNDAEEVWLIIKNRIPKLKNDLHIIEFK